jgi:hypothetical protein
MKAFIDQTAEINEYNDRQSLGGPAPSTPWENRIKEHIGWIGDLPASKQNNAVNNGWDRSSAHAIPSTEWENIAKEYNVQVDPSLNKQYPKKPKCTYNIQGDIICPNPNIASNTSINTN